MRVESGLEEYGGRLALHSSARRVDALLPPPAGSGAQCPTMLSTPAKGFFYKLDSLSLFWPSLFQHIVLFKLISLES